MATKTGEPSKLKVKVRVNTHGIFGVMNAYIVEKTIVEEPPPPAADTAPTDAATASSAAPTDAKEQTEKQEETKTMEDNVETQDGSKDTQEAKPKDEAAAATGDSSKEEQKSPPDVQMTSEGEIQETNGTSTNGQGANVETMETEQPANQQTQPVSQVWLTKPFSI